MAELLAGTNLPPQAATTRLCRGSRSSVSGALLRASAGLSGGLLRGGVPAAGRALRTWASAAPAPCPVSMLRNTAPASLVALFQVAAMASRPHGAVRARRGCTPITAGGHHWAGHDTWPRSTPADALGDAGLPPMHPAAPGCGATAALSGADGVARRLRRRASALCAMRGCGGFGGGDAVGDRAGAERAWRSALDCDPAIPRRSRRSPGSA